jgi:hypothetical protein
MGRATHSINKKPGKGKKQILVSPTELEDIKEQTVEIRRQLVSILAVFFHGKRGLLSIREWVA